MEKYIDIDLLRKDIDEWENAIADCVGEYSDGFRFALEHFTFLINHYCRQEQPEVDLDAEIEKELRLHYNDDQDVYWWNYLKNSFRHFYELGKNSK